MVGQRAVVVRVAGNRPGGVLARPVERADRPATGTVSPRLVVLVPVLQVRARGLAATVLRAAPRDLRRGRRGFPELRRPTGRGGRPARLPPTDLARPAALEAPLRMTSRAAARPCAVVAMVRAHAGRRVRRAPARRGQVRRTAGRARGGTPRVPPPMTMLGIAAGGPRPVVSSAARAGPRPRVNSAAVRGPRRAAHPVTGPGLHGRTGPGQRPTRMASVTAVGHQIATSGVMTAAQLRGLRATVPGDRTAATVPQRATGRVAPAAAMAPHLTAASVPMTAA
jgi:hypothetical protein